MVKQSASMRAAQLPAVDAAQSRQRLSKLLQLHGYSACREALFLLEDHYTSSASYESVEDFISKLNKIITFDIETGSSVIDSELAHVALQKLTSSGTQQVDLESPDTIDVDQANIENEQQDDLTVKLKNVQHDTCGLEAQQFRQGKFVKQQADDFNIHYNFLFKRLSALPAFNGEFKLTKLETLTASSQPSIRCVCFGLLVKDISKIDGFMLIDSSGRVPMRLTPDTSFRNVLGYSNCLVIVEGVYTNPEDMLYAVNIGLPPVLLDPIKEKSIGFRTDKSVVIIREVFLDDEDICNDLDVFFAHHNSLDEPPAMFILIGDFTRTPCEPRELRVYMKRLIRIMRSCKNLRDCHFVFVPGPHDTSLDEEAHKLMPKPPLSRERIPLNILRLSNFNNVYMATNPSHIYLGDRLITVVAHSYLKELRNNLLHDMSNHNEELFETVKKILLSNAHLSAGINKTYYSSMNLWHRPDLLILSDSQVSSNRYDYNGSSATDTSFATMPSFSRQSGQYKLYQLRTGHLEGLRVNANTLNDVRRKRVVEPAEDDDD